MLSVRRAVPILGYWIFEQDCKLPSYELTILMPCLNEARTVARCVERALEFLTRTAVRGEVLVADNGSTDGSQALAASAGARIINIPVRGYGAALIGGIEAAEGQFIIMGDADLSYDFSSLDTMLQELRSGAEIVMGDRFEGGIKSGAMPFLHRYLGNPVLSFVGRLFFRSPIRDFHCGLRVFRAESIRRLQLTSTGMEFASEMIVKASLRGIRVAQVPIILYPDQRGRAPHLRTWRDGWRHLRFLLVHAPAWLFFYPGIALSVVSSFGALFLSSGQQRVGQLTFDIHSLLILTAMALVGLQMIVFAALSTFHATQIGILPSLPKRFSWLKRVTLEAALAVGCTLMLLGVALVFTSVLQWASQGFRELDPRLTMRRIIPAAGCLILGAELCIAGFFLEFLRLTPRQHQT